MFPRGSNGKLQDEYNSVPLKRVRPCKQRRLVWHLLETNANNKCEKPCFLQVEKIVASSTDNGIVENLDKYTFNIIPDRDPVPAIDDPAKNFQKIHCLASPNNFVDCHTSTRSLCEIQYTCGSGNRPTLCDCALYFGYPEPEAIGDRTFAEACPSP